jgi:hypothetical protein
VDEIKPLIFRGFFFLGARWLARSSAYEQFLLMVFLMVRRSRLNTV